MKQNKLVQQQQVSELIQITRKEKRKENPNKNESDWNKYKSSRNSANIALRQAKREYYITKFQNPKTNPRHAWQTINDILGRNNNTNTIHEIKHLGKTVSSNEELKEIFNEYFTNIGPNLAQTIRRDRACNFEDFVIKRGSVNQFSFEAVNELMVYTLINKLPNSKSVGLDKISTKILQIAAPAVAQPLTKIFNKSIALGQFP